GGRPYEPLSDPLFAHRNTIHAHPSTSGSGYRRWCYRGRGYRWRIGHVRSTVGRCHHMGTLKAGYSAVVIESIIAAVRGSFKILTHVRKTGSSVALAANATRQTMVTVSGSLLALRRNLASAWSVRPAQESTPGYRLISAA